MDLTEFGSWGYQVGGCGILAFTLVYLVSVRWTSDYLGRILAAVLVTVSAIFLTGGYRLLNPNSDAEGFLVWRAFLYGSFGIVIWMAFVSFIWSQFFAPRIKRNRKEKKNEKVRVASHRPDRDGDLHDGAGCSH